MHARQLARAAAAVAVAVLALVPAAASAASGPIVGRASNGIRISFTVDRAPNLATLTLNARYARHSSHRRFLISCGKGSKLENVVALLPLSNQRRIVAPAQAPSDARRCVVRRGHRVIARMRLHQRAHS